MRCLLCYGRLLWARLPRSSVDIPFTEGPVNLNWSAILKTVNDDPYEFFKEGGWSFLAEKDAVSPCLAQQSSAQRTFAPRRRARC